MSNSNTVLGFKLFVQDEEKSALYSKLIQLASPKWEDAAWVQSQLISHIEELDNMPLLDEHRLAELVDCDLIIGIAYYNGFMLVEEVKSRVLWCYAQSQDVTEEKAYEMRFQKFMEKIKLHG